MTSVKVGKGRANLKESVDCHDFMGNVLRIDARLMQRFSSDNRLAQSTIAARVGHDADINAANCSMLF